MAAAGAGRAAAAGPRPRQHARPRGEALRGDIRSAPGHSLTTYVLDK